MEHIKEKLESKIRHAAKIHWKESERDPDKNKHINSLAHLEQLGEYVRTLPVDHPFFKAFFNHSVRESEFFEWFLYLFGFYHKTDDKEKICKVFRSPEAFINWVANDMKVLLFGKYDTETDQKIISQKAPSLPILYTS